MKPDAPFRQVLTAIVTALLLAVGGCSQDTPPITGKVIATVDGQPVTEADLVAFMQVRRQPLDDPQAREAALTELIDLHLLAESARRDGLVDEQTRAQARVQELSLLANKALARFAKGQSVTESDVQTEYDRQIGLTGNREYRIRHLLLSDQMQAINAIERLKQGEPFETLLGNPTDGNEAGDLGWVNLAQVPASFSSVLRSLEPGQYSPTPIQSEYGWHVVYLDSVRDFDPPPLDSVEEGIRNSLSRSRLEAHLETLRRATTVQRTQP